MSNNLIFFDRSRSQADWQCSRRRYLNYDLDGRGIVPEDDAYALMFGTAIHTGIASMAQGQLDGGIDIDAIAAAATNQVSEHLTQAGKLAEFVQEQSTLAEGMLRGFHVHVWPRLMQQYPKILAIEQEMSYQYGNTLFMAKPDLVVADTTGTIFYLEWKTTSSKKEEWVNSWNTAVQLHATTRAIEASLGESIGAVQVIGLYKGYISYGKQSSPLIYAYKRSGTPPFSKDDIAYEYKAGYKRYPTWELPGGVKAWIAGMPEDILSSQFPCTPPIFINDDLVESFFAQRNIREQEIAMAKGMLVLAPDEETTQAILNTSFPQTFSECSPAWGTGCPYKRICFGDVARPLEQGFMVRESHHAIEADIWKAENAT